MTYRVGNRFLLDLLYVIPDVCSLDLAECLGARPGVCAGGGANAGV